LGKAILYSLGKKTALEQGLLSDAMGSLLVEFPEERRRSVVLIDEIDKAPRDVPNDMLDEIDHLSFAIRELGNRPVLAHPEFRPVVVMTSNSERDLPKPFLRRCVYYHMRFPSKEVLDQIVDRRVGKRFQAASGLLGQAITFFGYLREKAGLRQSPGLAELLDFLAALAGQAPPAELRSHPNLQALVKATLLKDRHDQEQSDRDLTSWLNEALGRRDGEP
jgi:MoxR-like ATPase